MITKTRLIVALSFAVSAGLGIVFVRSFLLDDQLDIAIADAKWLYLVPTPFIYLAALYLRSRRWSIILNSTIEASHGSLVSPVLVGYMINAVAPVRLGDFVRGYYVSVREKCGLLTTMGTVAVEKARDTGTVLALFVIGGLIVSKTLATSAAFEGTPGGDNDHGDHSHGAGYGRYRHVYFLADVQHRQVRYRRRPSATLAN